MNLNTFFLAEVDKSTHKLEIQIVHTEKKYQKLLLIKFDY